MAYERNWAFFPSFDTYVAADVATQMKRRLWAIKAFLCGQIGTPTLGLWQVYGSSDGATAGLDGPGNGGSTDRWGATFDASKIPAAAGGSPHGWCVLKSPLMNGMTFYMLLAADTASAASGYATMNFAKAAYTGGTASANPTSTDSWGPMSNGAFIATGGLNQWLHGALSANGDFFIWSSRQGFADPEAFYAAIAPVGCAPGDAYPIWTAGSCYAGGNAAVQTIINPGAGTGTRNGAGTASQSQLSVLSSASGAQYKDLLTGKVLDIPAWVTVIVNAVSIHARGRLPDIGTTPFNGYVPCTPVGSAIRDGSNNVIYLTVGALILPFNSVPTLQ